MNWFKTSNLKLQPHDTLPITLNEGRSMVGLYSPSHTHMHACTYTNTDTHTYIFLS